MREKKQFSIPKNYEKKFEMIPGISGLQHLAFIPMFAVDFFILQHTNFDFSNKIMVIAGSLGFPWILMGRHPVRENVPLWKHLYWKLKFMSRQRVFQYKKEGYVHVEPIQQVKVNARTEQVREEKEGAGKTISTRLNSGKGDRGRIPDNSRQQDNSVSKSVIR